MQSEINFDIHGLLRFKMSGTNKRLLNHFKKDYSFFITDKKIEPDITIIVADFLPELEDCYSINNKFFIKNNYIYCKDNYKMVNWSFCIKYIEANPTLYFQGSRFSEIFLRDSILEPLIAFKMAQKGYTFLHASSAAYNNTGFAFAACQGVGKTSTLMNLISNGAILLSNEPSLIANDGTIYSFPTYIHFYHYNLKGNPKFSKKLKVTERIELELKNLMYLLSFKYASFPLNIDASRMYGKIGDKYPLETMFLLIKTNRSDMKVTENCDVNKMVKKLMIVNGFELEYFSNWLNAYSFIFPESLTNDFWKQTEQNLLKALENISCCEVEIPKNYDEKVFQNLLKIIQKKSL